MNANRAPLLSKPFLRASAGALIAIGVVLSLFAIFADTLDIGGGEGFGYQQLIGLICGIVLILGGLALAFQRYLSNNGRDTFEPER